MLALYDVLFTLIHLVLIIFNLTGWAWKKTRRAHLVVLLATATSWFILGIWYGWGYCPLTDWHWKIKEKLGEVDLPDSFIKYLADKISGRDIPSAVVDMITLVCLLGALLASVYVNFFRGRKRS